MGFSNKISQLLNATFVIAAAVLWATGIAESTGPAACSNLAQSLSINGVRVVSSTWYQKGNSIDLPGLVPSCVSEDGGSSTEATANLCRLVANVTTSPSSEILIESWLPEQ